MKKKIAIFTTGWSGEILTQFLTGMIASLKDERVDLFLFTCYPTYIDTAPVKKGELNIFTLPDLNDFDGVVVFCSGLGFNEEIDKLIERANKANVPVILQGAKRDGVSYIGSDNYYATRMMCEHLYKEHEVGSIVFIAGSKDSLDSELRLKAVRDYLEENGISEHLKDVYYTKWENAAASRYINRYCEEGKALPDVFICANDGLAMQTCTSLFENGYDVPKDTLVTGYDYLDAGQIFDPSIASVDQCFTQMGEACGALWLDIIAGKKTAESVVIPCEFIPGESCGCYELRNSDSVRRRFGREAFAKRSTTTYFNRKLSIIDSTVLSCLTFHEFMESLHKLLTLDHNFEGDSFHVLLEPNFGLSIYDTNIKLKKDGYSKLLDVLYSTEDGVAFDDDQFASKDLVPGYDPDGKNHLYIFLPLHEADEAYGYIIFRDCMDKVQNHFLQTYQSRMSLVFDKFRHALSLDLINKRLIEVMRRDPLTNVNNRIAYDDKEKFLQAEINSESGCEFAIAMFDVNNLKLVNDSYGHDAGDDYLIRACRLICNVFKHSPVYRIGGDEFVAVLTGDDYAIRDELVKKLSDSLSPYSNTLPLANDFVSVACGIAIYEKGTDLSVADIEKRADDAMYKDKARIKGLN
jgi:diguanylate cyclase (GGDEF)-like protein